MPATSIELVSSPVPAPPTHDDENTLLERALLTAEDVCASAHERFAVNRTDLEVALIDRGVLAKAFLIAVDRTAASLDGVPPAARCMWCWRAAGGTPEAWAALPAIALDEVLAHVERCEHGPSHALRARVAELERENTRLRPPEPGEPGGDWGRLGSD